jgi:PTH1 family peptidyl-tRNA hydrolase
MKAIIGLGNPGAPYALTRHNIGFIVVDYLAESHGASHASFVKKFDGCVCEVRMQDEKVLLFKPQTYMNRSGIPVSQLICFYKLALEDIFVIHDDLDLEPFRIKTKRGGSAGGHNGLKSLDRHVGKDYARLRIGIGRSPYGNSADYVLQKFSSQEMKDLENFLPRIAHRFNDLWIKGLERWQSDFYNR